MSVPELAFVGDIGGTNMRLGVASAEGVVFSESIPTPQDPDLFFKTIGDAATRYTSSYQITNGAIGFPGPVRVTPEGTSVGPLTNIASLNEAFDLNERIVAENKGLKGFDLLALNDAEAATHAAPSLVEGDTDGKLVTYITHSTGVGGDSIKDGVICSRADGMLAEYGHIPLLQKDGNYVTLENLVSGRAITERYGEGKKTPGELYQIASIETFDIWRRVGRDLGRGLAALVPIVGMSDIVIGGGVSRCHPKYGGWLMGELNRAVDAIPSGVANESPRVTYVPKDLIDTIGLNGAYFAAAERHKQII